MKYTEPSSVHFYKELLKSLNDVAPIVISSNKNDKSVVLTILVVPLSWKIESRVIVLISTANSHAYAEKTNGCTDTANTK